MSEGAGPGLPESHRPEPAPGAALVASLGVAALEYVDAVASTMDRVHTLAEQGAPAGTVVLAGTQTAGRGRGGRAWQSEPGAGLWFTVLERPRDERALDVLALRVGLSLAAALHEQVHGTLGLKWPNDLLVDGRKLAGILIEARWRDGRPEWVAIGVGINRRVPVAHPEAAAVVPSLSRDALLQRAVPAVRDAARSRGALSAAECAAWASRDVAVGRAVTSPSTGVAEGITPRGGLLVRDAAGVRQEWRTGSLRFADEP